MASGFRPEGLALIPDTAKDPPSACGVRAHKIHDSESPMVDCQQFTNRFVSGKKFPPFQIYIFFKKCDCFT